VRRRRNSRKRKKIISRGLYAFLFGENQPVLRWIAEGRVVYLPVYLIPGTDIFGVGYEIKAREIILMITKTTIAAMITATV